MRPALALLTAAALLTGGAACSPDDVEETIDEAAETAGEVASEVGEAVSDAATEVADAAQDTTDLAGFCSAAVRTRDAVEDNNAGDALEAAEDLAAEAPDEVRADAETVRDGIRAWHDGDEEALQDQEFRTAADEVRSYAEERCDPTS